MPVPGVAKRGTDHSFKGGILEGALGAIQSLKCLAEDVEWGENVIDVLISSLLPSQEGGDHPDILKARLFMVGQLMGSEDGEVREGFVSLFGSIFHLLPSIKGARKISLTWVWEQASSARGSRNRGTRRGTGRGVNGDAKKTPAVPPSPSPSSSSSSSSSAISEALIGMYGSHSNMNRAAKRIAETLNIKGMTHKSPDSMSDPLSLYHLACFEELSLLAFAPHQHGGSIAISTLKKLIASRRHLNIVIRTGGHISLMLTDMPYSSKDSKKRQETEDWWLTMVSQFRAFDAGSGDGYTVGGWPRRWLCFFLTRGIDPSCLPRCRFGSLESEWMAVQAYSGDASIVDSDHDGKDSGLFGQKAMPEVPEVPEVPEGITGIYNLDVPPPHLLTSSVSLSSTSEVSRPQAPMFSTCHEYDNRHPALEADDLVSLLMSQSPRVRDKAIEAIRRRLELEEEANGFPEVPNPKNNVNGDRGEEGVPPSLVPPSPLRDRLWHAGALHLLTALMAATPCMIAGSSGCRGEGGRGHLSNEVRCDAVEACRLLWPPPPSDMAYPASCFDGGGSEDDATLALGGYIDDGTLAFGDDGTLAFGDDGTLAFGDDGTLAFGGVPNSGAAFGGGGAEEEFLEPQIANSHQLIARSEDVFEDVAGAFLLNEGLDEGDDPDAFLQAGIVAQDAWSFARGGCSRVKPSLAQLTLVRSLASITPDLTIGYTAHSDHSNDQKAYLNAILKGVNPDQEGAGQAPTLKQEALSLLRGLRGGWNRAVHQEGGPPYVKELQRIVVAMAVSWSSRDSDRVSQEEGGQQASGGSASNGFFVPGEVLEEIAREISWSFLVIPGLGPGQMLVEHPNGEAEIEYFGQ